VENSSEQKLRLYKTILSKNGIKNTRQKECILLELIRSGTHLTADEIYQHLEQQKIGIATIYRNLKLFKSLNIVKEIPMNGVNYYELKIYSKKPLHIHFKCTKCNVLMDIDEIEISMEYIKLNQKIEEKKNLEVTDANIMLLGLCSKCREKRG